MSLQKSFSEWPSKYSLPVNVIPIFQRREDGYVAVNSLELMNLAPPLLGKPEALMNRNN